jgi:hypothetical protein
MILHFETLVDFQGLGQTALEILDLLFECADVTAFVVEFVVFSLQISVSILKVREIFLFCGEILLQNCILAQIANPRQ